MEDKAKKKRPILVWIITIFFLISAGWTLLAYLLIFSGSIQITSAQKTYFDSMSFFDYGYSIFIAIVNLSGAITLFILRKIAFYFFVTALSANILATIWNIIAKNYVEAIGTSGLIGMFIGLGIAASITYYSFSLKNKGILS